MHYSVNRRRLNAAAWIVVATLCSVSSTRAGTSYEAQLGGFMAATLQMLITGEFAGRSQSNADASVTRPICKPGDYDDLRAAANDQAAFDSFRRRCKLAEYIVDETHVHITAYLPQGYCETLKSAFDAIMAEHVYARPANPSPYLEYKGRELRERRARWRETQNCARHVEMMVRCASVRRGRGDPAVW